MTALHPGVRVVTAGAEQEVWRRHTNEIWDSAGVILRASWLPADLETVVAVLEHLPVQAVEMIGRAAIGAGLLRLEGDTNMQATAIEQLRNSGAVGNLVVVRAPRALKTKVGVWKPHPRHPALLSAVKRALDPNGILGAGRGPM
jgi:hypothetical protein